MALRDTIRKFFNGAPGASAGPFDELGGTGLKVYSGVVNEEFLRELQGPKGAKVYREMSESDPIIRAILVSISLMLRAVDWRVEPANDSAEAEAEAEFVRGMLIEDMSHPFEDFVVEALSMLVFGWSFHEIVYKLRIGPDEEDGARRSKFTDGRIGIRKLPIRAQSTLVRWLMEKDGSINGMIQQLPTGGSDIILPIERALLFRTTSEKNSPEGRSILRSAYRPWYILKNVEDVEAIGIERELAGLPVVRIPAAKLVSQDPEDVMFVDAMKKIARDLKFNQQGGIVIPSDVWTDNDGVPSSAPLVDVKLMTSGGGRAINPDVTITRHQRNIARSVLADFIMLGGDASGAYALSKNKTDLFLRSCEAYLKQIASPLNRFLLPRVWKMNNLNRDLMPQLVPGDVAPVNLEELGNFIQRIAGAGAPLFPDQTLSDHLADVAGLPKPEVDMGLWEQMHNPAAGGLGGEVDENGDPIEPEIDEETGEPVDPKKRPKPGEKEEDDEEPPVKKGEQEGHPFRGNQWSAGEGGGGRTKQIALASLGDLEAAATKHKQTVSIELGGKTLTVSRDRKSTRRKFNYQYGDAHMASDQVKRVWDEHSTGKEKVTVHEDRIGHDAGYHRKDRK